MEDRPDLSSILPFLPLIIRSSSLFWPTKALESLKALSLGPDVSRVYSGEVLFDAILDLRNSLGISAERLDRRAGEGYALYFDDLMSRADSRRWFGEVFPLLVRLLLRLPILLEEHYSRADSIFEGRTSGLRLLRQQEAGIVFLSQELVAALLVCSLLCLFPYCDRGRNHLPTINFDHLFGGLLSGKHNQEEKLKCLIHYFERVTSSIPEGFVSYERKVLPLDNPDNCCISYPKASEWEKSIFPLCQFQVSQVGLIEDQTCDAVEVDFANEYLGGGALHMGCVQEEIRFMINPELIAGMLFLSSMRDNEAIEIVGAERFASYKGYASSFQFMGDYHDQKPFDVFGRRNTIIVAIDALYCPGMMQYDVEYLLRETNKAFCGFVNQTNYLTYLKTWTDNVSSGDHGKQVKNNYFKKANMLPEKVSSADIENYHHHYQFLQASVSSAAKDSDGVATGNWGCGAFGGDPELKSMIQWIAASQALRPFILYYTFREKTLDKLEQVAQWILEHEWIVGDLWSILAEYSTLRLNRRVCVGFFEWLLPSPVNRTSTDYEMAEQDQ